MKAAPTGPDGETREERQARAAALQAAILAKPPKKPVRVRKVSPTDEPLVPAMSDAARSALQGMKFHARRYGFHPSSRSHLRRMGCWDLSIVAEMTYGKCVNGLGYAQADAVRVRIGEIVAEIEAGAPEPGIRRMAVGLDDETRLWLSSRPIEDLSGRRTAAKVTATLRAAGHVTLGALASEEVDEVEDIHGIGSRTVVALQARIADILMESEGSPSRGMRRALAADDAEWDAASPREI